MTISDAKFYKEMYRKECGQTELLKAEVDRLNKWADSFSDAQSKERRLCEDRIKEIELSRDAADHALQSISLMLGGPDEWPDQETMIVDVKRRVEEMHTALEPFAEIAKEIQPVLKDTDTVSLAWADPKVGDFRRALSLVKNGERT